MAKVWFQGLSTEQEPEYKLTLLPLVVWALIVGLTIAGILYSGRVLAEPIFKAETDGVVVFLHSDACDVTEITNLPYKATWQEKGKTFNGCWGPRQDMGVVMFYFLEDRTVGIIPIQALKRVSGA